MNQTLQTGSYIGKYRIIEKIGRGGMAEVFKGHQENLNRNVAIKVMHTYLAEEESFLVRFQREARAMAAAEHPNIVHVYDFDVDNNYYYIVMEYLSGGSLKDRIDRHNRTGDFIEVDDAIRIIAELTDALGYAHQCGMIHRDIKPANIMFNERGAAVLTDFGIAKMMTGTSFMTSTGAMIGTPAYMSPEQGLGEAGDMRSDIYSLGALAYHLLAGRLPHDGDTPLSVVLKHVNDTPMPISSFNTQVPPEVEAIIEKAMAKTPDERYQIASDMGRDLKKVLNKSKFNITSTMTLGDKVDPNGLSTGGSQDGGFPDDWDASWEALEPKVTTQNEPNISPEDLDFFRNLGQSDTNGNGTHETTRPQSRLDELAQTPVPTPNPNINSTLVTDSDEMIPDWMQEMEVESIGTPKIIEVDEDAEPPQDSPLVPDFIRQGPEAEPNNPEPVAGVDRPDEDLLAALMGASSIAGGMSHELSGTEEGFEADMKQAISVLDAENAPILTTGHVRRVNRREAEDQKKRMAMAGRFTKPIFTLLMIILGGTIGFFTFDQYFDPDKVETNPFQEFNAWLNIQTGGETAENVDLTNIVATPPPETAANEIISNLAEGGVTGTAIALELTEIPADTSSLVAIVQVQDEAGNWNSTQWSFQISTVEDGMIVQPLDDSVLDGRTYRWAIFQLPNSVEPVSVSDEFVFPDSGDQVIGALSLAQN